MNLHDRVYSCARNLGGNLIEEIDWVQVFCVSFFCLQRLEAFLSFDEGCAFAECALVVEAYSWESLLSQMVVSIISSGVSPAFIKSFFVLISSP